MKVEIEVVVSGAALRGVLEVDEDEYEELLTEPGRERLLLEGFKLTGVSCGGLSHNSSGWAYFGTDAVANAIVILNKTED